ncbi:MAG: hypothetical protein JWQ89_3702 [Devosia sp.]|uniref:hypothetical protein n=1 Tax=Devosia sp. TaxID=1871048 RepID=UPI00261F6DCC|nr:hypothetical protein [Devosia sp.]MDB5541975.1 hypothetical protein [Devosia sp.]
MTPEQELYRANRAKEVLDNEIYIEAFAAIEQELTDQWKSSPARDAEGREKLWLMQALLGKIKVSLEATMASGTVAKDQLRHKQTLIENATSWLQSR